MNNQTNNRITLRAKSDPSITISGELMYEYRERFDVRLAPGVYANSFPKTDWERVYDLPTEPGTVIRATILGVPNVLAFGVEGVGFSGSIGRWCSVRAIAGWHWHRDKDIDVSTVVVEFTPSDEEANA